MRLVLEKQADKAAQGNFDPALLQADNGSGQVEIESAVREMLTLFGPQKYIANLGSGLVGTEDPSKVACFVDCVHNFSEEEVACA